MYRNLVFTLAVLAVCGFAPTARAQVRLIGITGNKEANAANDETLYEIDLTDASTTRLFQTAHVPDTDSIGYNPVDGYLYHISGSSTYRDEAGLNGYRDNHYMEKFNMEAADPAASVIAVFNGNPPSAHVPGDLALEFGLEAPFPDWLLPDHPRLDSETDPAIGDLVGDDEYDSAREMAWSAEDGLFYLATGRGFYTMTPGGDSTFIGQSSFEPGDMKAIEFVEVSAETKLLSGSKETGLLYEIDPATGLEIGDITDAVQVTVDGSPTKRILALTTHPDTGVLYGLLEPDGGDPITDRQLVTIDPTTGAATVIGTLRNDPTAPDAAFAALAFVGFTDVPAVPGDYNGNGKVDAADYVLWRNGVSPLQNEVATIGTTTPEDYTEWVKLFGNMSGGGAGGVGAVPEPASALLLIAGLASLLGLRARVD